MRLPAPALLLSLALLGAACQRSEAPSLEGLELGLGYDEVAEIAGGQGEHVHDRGVRILRWHYPDGSIVEAGVHDGQVSGVKVLSKGPGEGTEGWKAMQSGLHSEMTAVELRAHFEPPATTSEDSSDREVRWTWDDGTLTATFMRGRLESATWLAAGAEEPEVLVDVRDRIAFLLTKLEGGQPADRYRALLELRPMANREVADALLVLLRKEEDIANRSLAASILADLGDERGSDLLLVDLERRIIPDAILDAIGKIGNHDAADALEEAERRTGSVHTQAKIRSARAEILERIGP